MAGLLSWVGRKIRLTDGAFWTVFTGAGSWSGKTVTTESALNISAYWACVRLISETIATLPISIFKTMPDGDRQVARDHPLYGLLHDSPNADQTAVEFWEGVGFALCTVGNFYAEKVRGTQNRLVALNTMPLDTRPYYDDNYDMRFRFTDRGKSENLPADKVFLIKGFGAGGDLGLSPISYARESLGLALATEESAGRTFSQGMRASGIFSLPDDMTAAQKLQFKKNYIEKVEGVENEGKSLVLPPGFRWQAVNIPPKDAEMLLSRRFNVEEVCRWLRVPPILVGHAAQGQTMWGSGIEQIMLGFLILGLRPYLSRIEGAIKKRLMLPEERLQFVSEFNVEGLLRADSQGRAQLMSIYAQNGLRTRNELRRLDNFAAMPGGDELTVQTNLAPLNQLGAASADPAASARNALLDWIKSGLTDDDVKRFGQTMPEGNDDAA